MMSRSYECFKKVVLVIGAFFFAGTILFARGESMGGLLLSGGHNQIFVLDFDHESISELARIPTHGNYSENYLNLEKVNDEQFLFETTSHKVGIYDLRDLQEKILFDNSSCPIYFQETGEILFSRVEERASGFEEYLYIASIDGKNPVALKKLARGSASKCPVKLNQSEAIVFLSYGKNKELAIFNAKDRAFIEKRDLCDPVFGLNDQKLLCLSEGSYFVSDHNGKKLREIKNDILNINNMFPVASLNEINSILVQEYNERLFRETVVNLWLLDLGTLERRLVVKDFGVGKKGAIYLDR